MGQKKLPNAPTGGIIKYTYTGGTNGINCTDGTTPILTRQVIPGGSEASGTWKYTRTINPTSPSTEITDPNTKDTVISFQIGFDGNYYEVQRKLYDGLQGSGTLLETIDTCYNGGSIPCTAPSNTITSRSVQTTLASFSPSETSTTYNSYGLPTETDEYNFGSTLVSKAVTTYSSCGVTNPNVLDRPCSVTIKNASGTAKASTSYTYDGNGNMLSETRSTGGTPATVIRQFTYGSGGVLASSTDFSSHTTTYSSFTCGANGSNTAFPQTITLPSPLSYTRTLVWNCNGAMPSSITDENSQPTTYGYDNMLRPTSVSYADGGSVSTYYTNANTRDIYTAITSTSQRHNQIDLDGMGRAGTDFAGERSRRPNLHHHQL